ncbi:MAG: RNA methyltransferase [Candidatus Paceibacterota bacterium]
MIAILHNIRSMHNVGSIFRTADASGIKKIYICGITPTPTDRFGKIREQISKVSLGAEKYLPWEYYKSITTLIKRLKKEKYKIIALEQDRKSIPYYKLGFNENKIAIVVGNEIKGIPKNILKLCDKIVEIPMRGRKESLNVSVAFGILVFELIKK